MTGSLQLRDYPGEKCGRAGQYRKQRLGDAAVIKPNWRVSLLRRGC
jgi:hypothetical protein